MKIVHHSKTVGFGGTDKVAQIMCKYLNQMGPEAYLLYRDADTSRLLEARRNIGNARVFAYNYVATDEMLPPFTPAHSTLRTMLEVIDPDIFHIHRSGYPEWPADIYPEAKLVETNIFGYVDSTVNIDHIFYVSSSIRRSMSNTSVMPNPVELPKTTRNRSRNKWLNKLSLTDDVVLLGRVGRADNFTPISLLALKHLNNSNVHYLVLSPCPAWKKFIDEHKINNVHLLDPILSDLELSEFYNAIDILAHARVDGETFGHNIAEAMIHGKPVISHRGITYNGHLEFLPDYVADSKDYLQYSNFLNELVLDSELRNRIGERNRKYAENNFAADVVVERLIQVYEKILRN